jgi:hypothetical protein
MGLQKNEPKTGMIVPYMKAGVVWYSMSSWGSSWYREDKLTEVSPGEVPACFEEL